MGMEISIQSGTDGDFDGDEVGEAVVLGTASEDDDLEGEGDGAGQGEEVSAIERGSESPWPGGTQRR